jgi:ATP-binding cassette subfamily B protein RaxB
MVVRAVVAHARSRVNASPVVFRKCLPVLLQAEASECAVTCLAMVAGYHGSEHDVHALRARLGATPRGWTLKRLIGAAAMLGLSARALRVELDDLHRLVCPAILHWDFDHFVVLKRADARTAVVHNPAAGERRFPLAELSKHFTGIALELTPTAAFERGAPPQRLRLAAFWRGLDGLARPLAQLLVLSVLIQLFALATPSYLQLVVDDVLVKRDVDALNVLAIGFALLAAINVATKALRGWANAHLANRLNFSIGARIFAHLLRLPLDYFQRRHVGDVVSRFRSLKPIQDFITGGFVTTAIDGVMAVTTLFVLVAYSPLLTSISIGASAAYAALRLVLFAPLERRSHETIVAEAKLDSHLLETLRALQGIKLFGAEPERERTWQNRAVDALNAAVRVARMNLGYEAANGLLFGVENVLIVFAGAHAVLSGKLTIGMLYAFVAYRTHFSSAMQSLTAQFIQARMLALHLERVADIALTEPADNPPAQSAFVAPVRGELALDRVGFAYPGSDAPVLRDVDVAIEAGEWLAIVGPSGVGKSTLLRVLLGLAPPGAGRVRIDGVPLERLGPRSFRAGVAALLQDDMLLSGSIRDNVSFFDPSPDVERLERATRDAAIHADIAALPMGFSTHIGDMGSALSLGQQQRLLLARALYREPTLLVLDEGTSRLDPTTELAVMRAIAARRITCVYTTHRDAVAQFADRVLTLSPNGWTLARAAAEHRR